MVGHEVVTDVVHSPDYPNKLDQWSIVSTVVTSDGQSTSTVDQYIQKGAVVGVVSCQGPALSISEFLANDCATAVNQLRRHIVDLLVSAGAPTS